MYRNLKNLFALVSQENRQKFVFLQIFVILMAVIDVVSIMLIGFFLSAAGDITLIQEIPNILTNNIYFSHKNDLETLYVLGICAFIMLIISASISVYTTWKLSMFGAIVGAELSNRLFNFYLSQGWLYHVNNSSSSLTNKIVQEAGRVSGNIISPLMQMNAKLISGLLICVALVIYDPMITSVGATIFGGVYYLLYVTLRRSLGRNGSVISQAQEAKYRLMSDGFGGIKDIIILSRQEYFYRNFIKKNLWLANALGKNQIMSQVPRFAIEFVALGVVVIFIMVVTQRDGSSISSLLGTLSVYGLAMFKLMPAFQIAYTGISQIKGNLNAFEQIKGDLSSSVSSTSTQTRSDETMHLKNELRLSDVSFAFASQQKFILKNINVVIPALSTVGLVGVSGSGKSTTADIISGLMMPTNGNIEIDGTPLTEATLKSWRRSVGVVSQSIFLSETTIKENIAFGLDPKQIDEEKLASAIISSRVSDFLIELPNGIDTKVGERGVTLSGGQKQRIGVARALYCDADLLILDEATSALDGITEKFIMDSFRNLAGRKTILMIAHRLGTVKNCDIIYFFEQGRVTDSGTFDELCRRNSKFRELARLH